MPRFPPVKELFVVCLVVITGLAVGKIIGIVQSIQDSQETWEGQLLYVKPPTKE